MFSFSRVAGFALPLILVVCFTTTRAQSLIVGIPNAEVTHQGKFALTHESQSDVWRRDATWNSFSFLTYGLSKKVELAVSLSNLAAPRSGNLSMGVGYKFVHQFAEQDPRLSRWELKATVGQMLLLSLEPRLTTPTVNGQPPTEAGRELQSPPVGGWVYAHGSLRLPGPQTRLTAGVSYGSSQAFGVGNYPVSFMGGVEQPVVPWLSLVADWYSGTHALASFIPAIQFNLKRPKGALIVGYKRPNDPSTQRDAAILEFMVEF